jgi:hypothetical protein
MSSGHYHARLQSLGTVIGAPESGLRFMRRRRVGTADRNGDPLDGLANTFTVAIAFAVALLVTVLVAVGLGGLLTDENLTIITNPGTPEMQMIVKEGDQITKLDMRSGAEMSGTGTLLGSFYELADGTVIWVPRARPRLTEPRPRRPRRRRRASRRRLRRIRLPRPRPTLRRRHPQRIPRRRRRRLPA